MRVGLNLLGLVPAAGGVGTYMRELTAALAAGHPDMRLTVFHSRELPPELPVQPWASAVEWVRQPVSVSHGPPGNVLLTLGAQLVAQPLLGRRRRLDVIHGLAYSAPLSGLGARTVVTVPDLIYTRYPGLLDRRTRLGMAVTVGVIARAADRVIAISDACRDDIVHTLRVPRERVDVTPLGVRVDRSTAIPVPAARLRAAHDLHDAPVVLCVAQKRPHKNLAGLVRAIADVPGAVALLVGLPTPHEAGLRALAGPRVRFAGWVSDAELEGLYALAACCCVPSFEEGFGLGVLEAMARGVPVACSADGALGEVGGDAVEAFDPYSDAQIAAALRRLLTDAPRRAQLVARGRERAAAYPWAATARATVATYERALAGGRA